MTDRLHLSLPEKGGNEEGYRFAGPLCLDMRKRRERRATVRGGDESQPQQQRQPRPVNGPQTTARL